MGNLVENHKKLLGAAYILKHFKGKFLLFFKFYGKSLENNQTTNNQGQV